MRDLEKETGINLHNPPIQVVHAHLKRTGESPYRSECPFCFHGVLLVGRDEKAGFRLMAADTCICCGQAVEYLDIEEMRKAEGNP